MILFPSQRQWCADLAGKSSRRKVRSAGALNLSKGNDDVIATKHADGNLTQAAKRLGVTGTTLSRFYLDALLGLTAVQAHNAQPASVSGWAPYWKECQLALTLNNLAFIQEGRGQLQEAETHYRRALDILRSAHGPHHPQVADVSRNLDRCRQDSMFRCNSILAHRRSRRCRLVTRY